MAEIKCRDSKKYGHNWIRMAKDIAESPCAAYAVYETWPAALMRQGYGPALRAAYRIAIDSVRHKVRPHYPRACIDGSTLWYSGNAYSMPRADQHMKAVSLASCYGKLAQVRAMQAIHSIYPEYGFDHNHGYFGEQHKEALIKHGLISGVHRFRIITDMPIFRKIRLPMNPLPYVRPV